MNLLTLPIRNLFAQKVRSTLTVLGIAVAVGSFIAMTGLTRGLQDSYEHSVGDVGGDFVVSQKGSYSMISGSMSADFGPALSAVAGVEEAPGIIVTISEVDEEANIFVTGWPDGSFLWNSLNLAEGKVPTGDREVVLGKTVADSLGKSVGDEIQLRYETFTISGIAVPDSVFNQNIAVTRLVVLQELLGRPDNVSLFHVRIKRPFTAEKAAEIRKQLLAISPTLAVSDSAEFAGSMQFVKTMEAVAAAVSLVMIFASLILVANTLLMAVSERAQEFGILAAIGWTPGKVRLLVVLEGLLMCILGSVIGGGLGVAAMYIVSWLRISAGALEPYLTVPIVAEAVGWVMLVGPAAAFYPAWQITRIPPSAALRGTR